MDLFYREFGTRLREARQRRELTQGDLAEQVGMSRASIANIELGRQRVPLHMIRNFADALNIESVELLPTGPATEETAAAGLDRLHPENHDDVLRILRRGRQEREVENGETTRR